VTTAQALVAALRHFDSRRLVLVTPYIEAVTRREEAFFAHHGFDVFHSASYGINLNWDMAQEPPETWTRLVLDNRRNEADAYLLSCTAIRSAEIIDGIEAVLGKPVITSNQALMWHCLRSLGIERPVKGFGRLLA
jgi:maleate isomerase